MLIAAMAFSHRTAIALLMVLLTLLPVFALASDFQTPSITPQDLHESQVGD